MQDFRDCEKKKKIKFKNVKKGGDFLAEHICQIKKRSDGNFFLKRANEHFFVSGHSN